MDKVHITETILRDAHQCLIATRLRTEDMLPIADRLDQVGYWALEVWGGATFDSCLRFLKEDPWERLRQLKKSIKKTPLSMLLRGQNLVGYRHYADDIVKAFIAKAAKNGVDVFRVFDALNDLRNLEASINAVHAAGKHAQGAICYTISPVHNTALYIQLAKDLAAMGCDSLAIKDMAGLLTPNVTVDLIQQLQAAVNIPLHIHSHATAGVAGMCLFEAVQHGCRHVDTALSAFAEGASHTSTESLVIALQDTPFDTGLDLTLLQEIADYFRQVRKKYQQFESESTGIDPRIHIYQVPGGMISNLYSQLKQQNALDKLPQVHQEIPRVRQDLGYPPLVTPSSQIVGTQAVLNVITGERYKTITNEVKLYCQGKYGKPPGKINPSVLKKAIGKEPVIEGRPADLLKNELAKFRQEVKTLAQSEEDVLSYAMFPDIAKKYFEERNSGQLKPEPLITKSETAIENSVLRKFNISLHGESYAIQLTGSGDRKQKQRAFYLTIDGVPEEILVDSLDLELAKSERPSASTPGDVTVSMPSTIVVVHVKVGDEVQAGEPLLITEAMKMETEVQAPIAGKIIEIHVKKGDSVNPDEVLMRIEVSNSHV